MFAGSPSKVATVNPAHSASAASSVKSLRPSRAARRWASRMTSKRKACGVCAIRSRARSGVASTLPLSPTCLIVSVTGIAGTAAPVRPAASIAREITADVTKGRAASWIKTISGFCARQRLKPGMHRRLTRRAAVGRRLMAQPATASLNIAASSGFTTGCTANTSGWRQNASIARKITVWPPIVRYCLARPRRREARARLRRGWLLYARVWALDSITNDSGLKEGWGRLAHSPYHAECAKTERFPIAVGKAVFVAVHLHK